MFSSNSLKSKVSKRGHYSWAWTSRHGRLGMDMGVNCSLQSKQFEDIFQTIGIGHLAWILGCRHRGVDRRVGCGHKNEAWTLGRGRKEVRGY